MYLVIPNPLRTKYCKELGKRVWHKSLKIGRFFLRNSDLLLSSSLHCIADQFCIGELQQKLFLLLTFFLQRDKSVWTGMCSLVRFGPEGKGWVGGMEGGGGGGVVRARN